MESVNIERKKVSYKATGIVTGYLWGNDTHKYSYPARELFGETFEDIISQIKMCLKDKSLDSGMGFQSLEEAQMQIHTFTTLTIEGKKYINKSTEYLYFENK